MSRYIDIDDISLRKTVAVGGLSAKALWRRIQQAPSIDIVRCKECKKRDTFDCGVAYYDESWDEWHYDVPSEEWFCADGEREGE